MMRCQTTCAFVVVDLMQVIHIFPPFTICLVVEVIVAITIVIVLGLSYVTLLYVNHFFPQTVA